MKRMTVEDLMHYDKTGEYPVGWSAAGFRSSITALAMGALRAEGAPQKIPADIEVIGSYPEDIDGGHRWWWSGGNWLYPGDVVAVFKLADSQSMNYGEDRK